MSFVDALVTLLWLVVMTGFFTAVGGFLGTAVGALLDWIFNLNLELEIVTYGWVGMVIGGVVGAFLALMIGTPEIGFK